MNRIAKYIVVAVAFVALASTAQAGLKYKVKKVGGTMHVTFEQRSFLRIHTSPKFAPYITKWVRAKKDVIKLTKGQWMEGRQPDGSWALLSDADNR